MSKEIEVRIRVININDGKVLLMYDSKDDSYSYVGGRLEYGETIEQGAKREVKEECGDDIEFKMNKVLYIRDYIVPAEEIHSIELFILGDVNKFKQLEGRNDPEYGDRNWLEWRDIYDLPSTLYPTALSSKLLEDFKNNFPNQGEYLGNIGEK